MIYLSGTFDVPDRPRTEVAVKEFSTSNAKRGVQAVISVFLGKRQSMLIIRTTSYFHVLLSIKARYKKLERM